MTAIFIRIKSLMIFGLVLLSVSIVWMGVINYYKVAEIPAAGNDPQPPAQEVVTEPKAAQPTVTITEQPPTVTNNDYFSEYRMQRDKVRSERQEGYREIVNNPNSSAQMRQDAQRKLIKITDNLEIETKIENALIAKGFKDAIIMIQPETVMVIVPTAGLRQDEITRISDVVVKISGCKLENVVIVPKVQ